MIPMTSNPIFKLSVQISAEGQLILVDRRKAAVTHQVLSINVLRKVWSVRHCDGVMPDNSLSIEKAIPESKQSSQKMECGPERIPVI